MSRQPSLPDLGFGVCAPGQFGSGADPEGRYSQTQWIHYPDGWFTGYQHDGCGLPGDTFAAMAKRWKEAGFNFKQDRKARLLSRVRITGERITLVFEDAYPEADE